MTPFLKRYWHVIGGAIFFCTLTACHQMKRQNPWIDTNYRIQMGATWYHVELQFCPDGVVRWREGSPDDELNQKP